MEVGDELEKVGCLEVHVVGLAFLHLELDRISLVERSLEVRSCLVLQYLVLLVVRTAQVECRGRPSSLRD